MPQTYKQQKLNNITATRGVVVGVFHRTQMWEYLILILCYDVHICVFVTVEHILIVKGLMMVG